MRALIIDDSQAMRLILGNMLREIGMDVTEAANGRDALDALKRTAPPDLALLDWNMPEINGFEVLQAVRADPAFKAMRIVMVTSETETTQMIRALEAGADEYVMKPFTRAVVLEKLRLVGLVEVDQEVT
jgi:two-component system, chemotaxis family, chemotaxis protein CheY